MQLKPYLFSICWLVAFFLVPNGLMAQDTEVVSPGTGKRVDEFFTRFEALGFHGAVLVATKEGIVLSKGYGFADRQRTIGNAPTTSFGIASLDKQFTAAAILVLEQQGKLKTTDLISEHLDHVPNDKANITIDHLLNHRSGLPNTYRDTYSNLNFSGFLDKVLDANLAAPVGTKRIYSNSGYNLLEFIVERVSGKDYETFLAEHFFKPAGMNSTGQHLVSFSNEQMAQYREVKIQKALLEREPKRKDSFLSFRSTVGDLFRWHKALQNDDILAASASKKLFRTVSDNYANGWYVGQTVRKTPVQYHGGYDSAIRLFAMMYRYPAENTVIIVLSNTTMDNSLNRTHLSAYVERLIFGGTVKQPPLAVSTSDESRKPFLGSFRLDNGGEFQIDNDPAGLTVTASNRKAVQALVYPDFESQKEVHELDPTISDVMFGFERNDFTPLQMALWKEASFDNARKQWEQRWRGFQVRGGALKSVRAIHRLETEYLGTPEIQTHVLLQFEQRPRLVRALANADGRYWFDVINLPSRTNMRLVPVSQTELAGWNLKLQTGPRILLADPNGDKLIIKGLSGRATATRKSSK